MSSTILHRGGGISEKKEAEFREKGDSFWIGEKKFCMIFSIFFVEEEEEAHICQCLEVSSVLAPTN